MLDPVEAGSGVEGAPSSQRLYSGPLRGAQSHGEASGHLGVLPTLHGPLRTILGASTGLPGAGLPRVGLGNGRMGLWRHGGTWPERGEASRQERRSERQRQAKAVPGSMNVYKTTFPPPKPPSRLLSARRERVTDDR